MYLTRLGSLDRRIAFVGVACILAFLTPARSDGALISGSTLNINGDGTVGATFLNFNCDAPGGPASCPALSGDFGVVSSTGTFAQYNGTFGFEHNLTNAAQPLNTTFSLPNFITFVLNANESIELTFIPVGTDTPS